ncbi:hypothetical protein [Embleya sp. AB8]|uniref:hypothetical protein n=1 Tax=Embleya sp. AB8 TaxID=3156304 RepID=UPI003C70C7BD
MSANGKKARRPAKAVTNGAIAVVLSLGVGSVPTLVAAAPAGAATYNSTEHSTWIEGQTTIPILKDLIKGTTFLDWARPGVTQSVKMKNTLKQNIYVLQRIHAMFLLADMSTAIASMSSTVLSGGVLALFGSAVTEAMIRSAAKGAEDWQNWFKDEIEAEYQRAAKGEISRNKAFDNILIATAKKGASLNGDLSTVLNGLFGENGVFDRVTNTQSALAENEPFTKELVKRIKKEAQVIKPGETKALAKNNYIESAITFSGTNEPPKDFVHQLGNLLQAVNIMGPSGWAGQVGFPTVDMYVMTHDAKKIAHMTTAPNISWIVERDKIVPAADGTVTDLDRQEGLGYYLWTSTPNADGNLQTYNRKAYNALESIGFDRGAATVILGRLREHFTAQKTTADATTVAKATAMVLAGPSVRKLLWLDYKNGESDPGTTGAVNAAYWVYMDTIWGVSQLASGSGGKYETYISPDFIVEYGGDMFEKGAAHRFEKDNYPKNVNDEDIHQYDACLSATYYGLTFQDAQAALKEIGDKFLLGGSTIWQLAAPIGTVGNQQTSEYVELVAALNAKIKTRTDISAKLIAAIDKLATLHGKDPSNLRTWWESNEDLPADILAGLEA